jgi:hypothetical protein
VKKKSPFRTALDFYISVWHWLTRDALLVIFAFFAGIGAMHLYHSVRPDTIIVDNKYICVFRTPDGWIWPEEH